MAGSLNLQGVHIDSGNPTTYNESTTSPYAVGNLGKYFTVPNTTLFTPGLIPRTYQIVVLHSGSGTPAVGQFTIWQDRNNFVVTAAGTTTAVAKNAFAGILQNASATVGNLVAIQVGGEGPVLIEAATTPAIGDIAVGGGTTAGRSGVTAAGTAPTNVPVGVVTSLKNAGSIGTDVVRCQITAPRLF